MKSLLEELADEDALRVQWAEDETEIDPITGVRYDYFYTTQEPYERHKLRWDRDHYVFIEKVLVNGCSPAAP